ncbi:MAG: transcriptional repressor [Desulfobacterales bacterium]|nr:transcriptional repressor [Desulfobacterales bacterium]
MRQTEQRSLILEELKECARSGKHPGADEVYVRVKKRLPRISLATVYRNLELLAGSGAIKRLDMGERHMRFDGIVEPHCHFRCTECGHVEDLPFAVRLPPLDPRHPWVRARRIEGGQPEYFGLCPDCARHAAAPTRRGKSTRKATAGRVTP